VYRPLTNNTILRYTVLRPSVTHSRLNRTVRLKQFNVTVYAATVLAVRVSCSGPFIWHAFSIISRLGLRAIFNDLFARCQVCLRPEGDISNTYSNMWRSCSRNCTTIPKVAGSIPNGVIDIILPAALWSWGQLSL
jgi:hypothetical protein